MIRSAVSIPAIALILTCSGAFAYPEFHEYSEKSSGRRVDCAMCHVAPEGPSGTRRGQIGALNEKEMKLLQDARNTTEPGRAVHSPILNAFGNNLVKRLGTDKLGEMSNEPEKLAPAYGFQSDLDHDGITDAQEFLDGTDPLSNQSGRPSLLFRRNVLQHWGELLFLIVAGGLLLSGLRSLFLNLKETET